MKKTLLLCFIHGFKGNESTFGDNYAFTEDLRRRVAGILPKIHVKVEVYPKYETRGDLGETVSRFRDWLLNKVIDLEVAAGTPSPTVDPSVRVLLIGHSMGGIVAAETAIALSSEQPIHNTTNPSVDDDNPAGAAPPRPSTPNSLMFPYIQGVLAFDTPFLGVSPGVVAHGAEGHYTAASAAVAQLSGLTSLWGGAKAASSDAAAATAAAAQRKLALPAPEAKGGNRDNNASNGGGGWGRWGKIAVAVGAVGAVAAGGAAAYMNRDQISQGWNWASSHMEFVSVLARKEELRRRVAYMVRLNRELGVGFGTLYTRLGKAASARTDTVVGTVLGNQRTFCVVPQRDVAGDWRPAVNDKATDEVRAHMSMFEPKENPEYEKMTTEARDMIASWLHNDWYESSADAIRR